MALENDILERLRNGEDAEQIAQELINNLNNAIATKDKEDAEAKRIAEEKAKAEKEKQALEDKKNNLADAIARAMLEYYNLTLPEVPEGIAKGFDGPTVRKQLDATVDLLKSLVNLSKQLDKIDFGAIDFDKIDMDKVEAKLENLFGLVPASKKNKPKTSYEDAIGSFFRANGL